VTIHGICLFEYIK